MASRKVGFPHYRKTNPRFALMYFMVDFGSCCFFACSSIWIRQRHLALLWNLTKGLTVRGCHDDCPWWFRSVVMDLLNVDRFAARACLCIQVLEDLKSLEKLLPQKRKDTDFCHELLAFLRPRREMTFHPCRRINRFCDLCGDESTPGLIDTIFSEILVFTKHTRVLTHGPYPCAAKLPCHCWQQRPKSLRKVTELFVGAAGELGLLCVSQLRILETLRIGHQ